MPGLEGACLQLQEYYGAWKGAEEPEVLAPRSHEQFCCVSLLSVRPDNSVVGAVRTQDHPSLSFLTWSLWVSGVIPLQDPYQVLRMTVVRKHTP